MFSLRMDRAVHRSRRSEAAARCSSRTFQFLLIGPLWLLGFVYRRLGIAY